MLTNEEQAVVDRLRETVMKLEEDYEAGLISEDEYKAKSKLLDDAAYKIEALSTK